MARDDNDEPDSPPGFFGTLWRVSLVGALLFVLAGLAGYGVIFRMVKTGEVQAPDLLALELDNAVVSASSDGFATRVKNKEASSVLSAGQVVAQHPLPGDWVKPGATIFLTIAE